MKLDFSSIEEQTLSHFNGGEGALLAKMHLYSGNKALLGRLAPGSSIGMHTHTGSCEYIYILSGEAVALCGGEEETLFPGDAHLCPEGCAHSLVNRGEKEVRFFAVVPRQ